MRTREEIADDFGADKPWGITHNHDNMLILEVLLDIRDLLEKKSCTKNITINKENHL